MELVARKVGYRYGWRSADVLRDLSWSIPAGSRTVLLGPNGAGKSTLLGVLSQALRPHAGTVRLVTGARNGVTAKELRRRVAWMPQKVVAVPGLTAREQVAYAGWLKGMRREAAWERSLVCLETVGLTSSAQKKAAQLSGGQLRRMGLAEALVHDADFLLLDEPTAGLDPAQRDGFRRLLQRLPKEMAVVVSTHQVDDLGDLFDNVAVLVAGEWRFQGKSDDFLQLGGGNNTPRLAEAAYGVLVGGES